MITIRQAHWTDHAGVKTILDEFSRLHHRLDPGLFRPVALGFTEAMFQAYLDQPNDLHIVAEHERTLAGYVWASRGSGNDSMFTYSRRNIYIVVLAVSESHRRLGIGRRLFAEIETVAGDFQAEIMQLNVSPGNVQAKAFYEALGYAHTSETRTKVLKSIVRPTD